MQPRPRISWRRVHACAALLLLILSGNGGFSADASSAVTTTTVPPVAPVKPVPPATPAVATVPASKAAAEGGVFGLAKMHQVKVTIPAAEWAVLQNETFVQRAGALDSLEDDFRREDGRWVHIGGGFGGYFPWVHADLSFDGVTVVKDTALRYKGNGSYNASAGMHRNLKVKTDFYGGKADWDGLETINFNSGGRDQYRMKESLAFAVFRAAGVPAPRTSYAEVTFTVPGVFNDGYAGLYTVIENVNKQFLKNSLPPGNGLLMKPERMNGGVGYYGENWADYIAAYRPERVATPAEQRRVIEFARLVNQPSVSEFNSRIGDYLDVDEFLRFLAVTVMVAHSDSFLSGRHNFFIYLDPKDDKFRFIPWDVDTSLSQSNGSLMNSFSGNNPLAYWLLNDPAMAAKYRAVVRDITAKVFNNAELGKMLDALEPVVRQPLQRETAAMSIRGEYNNNNNRTGGGQDLRSFLASRVSTIGFEMAGWPPASP